MITGKVFNVKLAIMQPYLFPYLGYYQLMNAVDVFIYHDDVQFIKGGWINRNNILSSDGTTKFTLPVCKDSHERNINERFFHDFEIQKKKFLNKLNNEYRNAPFFNQAFNILSEMMAFTDPSVPNFIINTNKLLNNYLNISTEIKFSSKINKDNSLKGEERVIDLCKSQKADEYINSSGGEKLYSIKNFQKEGIQLHFLFPEKIEYNQNRNEFIPNLSIIDLMMFNSPQHINNMLYAYELK